jgi:uncharacterized caspase-like protein
MRKIACLIAVGLALAGASAHAREVALVIANSVYDPGRQIVETPNLRNVENDGPLIVKSLERAGFDQVVYTKNVNTDDFHRDLAKFTSLAEGADTALIYFAGHGVQYKRANWLIPVDLRLENAQDLSDDAVQLELLLDALAGAKLRIAVIDACRSSVEELEAASNDKIVAGLAQTDVNDALIIYAAAPGQFSFDSVDGSNNSPFARSFSARVDSLTRLQDLAGKVRDDVAEATGQQQSPFVTAGISGKNAFLTVEQYQRAMEAMGRPVEPVVEDAAVTEEKDFWKEVKDNGSIEYYRLYLETYPTGRYRKFAELEIAKASGAALQ